MTEVSKPEMYHKFIDSLVDMCHDGQGQIGAKRVLKGVWNQNATAEYISEQHAVNLLLERLSTSEREVLAKLLVDEVVTGVFETLKALEAFQVTPFESGYEGVLIMILSAVLTIGNGQIYNALPADFSQPSATVIEGFTEAALLFLVLAVKTPPGQKILFFDSLT